MKRYGLREQAVENCVSQVLGAMSVTWIVTRDCEWVEKSLIGLLSSGWADAGVLDPPSSTWLGSFSESREIRESGLWNKEHVGGGYTPDVLNLLP